ncbi:MAG TPA: hypothetical protein VNW04_15590 [Puia sp.]|nr:hypothetical protein [Puia sp.]
MAFSNCMKAEAQAPGKCCHQEMGGDNSGHCPKPEKGCNPQADCCLNCPLCYVVVLPGSAEPVQLEVASREYATWISSYGYLYHASCWKPPNAA